VWARITGVPDAIVVSVRLGWVARSRTVVPTVQHAVAIFVRVAWIQYPVAVDVSRSAWTKELQVLAQTPEQNLQIRGAVERGIVRGRYLKQQSCLRIELPNQRLHASGHSRNLPAAVQGAHAHRADRFRSGALHSRQMGKSFFYQDHVNVAVIKGAIV